jgi:hypothetical protein
MVRKCVTYFTSRDTRSKAGTSAPAGTPQQIAVAMLPSFGWPSSEFGCLNSLWGAESGWTKG